MIVYDKDDGESVFVLAEGYAPRIRFVGWMKGFDAKDAARPMGGILIVPRNVMLPFGAKVKTQ